MLSDEFPVMNILSPATHKKDLSDEEIEKSAKAAFAEMG